MTIGERIRELVNEYCDLYNELKDSDSEGIREKAKSLALHDLVVQKHIYEQAYLKTKSAIEIGER